MAKKKSRKIQTVARRRSGPRATGKRKSAAEVIDRLQSVAQAVVEAAEKGRDPSMDIPVRSLSNVQYNATRRIIELGPATQARNFFSLNMARKFMQTVLVASGFHQDR